MFGIFEKRVAVCYLLILAAMFGAIMRLVNLMLDPSLTVAANGTAMRTVTVCRQRGTLFDCNMEPITNRNKKYITLITDISAAANSLDDYFSPAETKDILSSAKEKKTGIVTSGKNLTGEGLASFGYTEQPADIALHLIGYTDSGGHGVSGLEAALDDYLYSDKSSTLTFGVDGVGNLIKGDNISYSYDTSLEKSGIMLTLDYDIQKAAEQAAAPLISGAVVVMEIKTGEIKASVSRPDFTLSALSEAVSDSSSPLLNRAMQTYSVGSGFKPLVAAAAIESGKGDSICLCQGYSDIDGQIFRCHKRAGHGWLTLAGALKHSCNAYFYNLAVSVGGEKIYSMAEAAGFNSAVSFGYRVSVKKAQIGDRQWLLTSKRALANLAIGQGELMVSPIGILSLYCAIAGDGSYIPPTLIKGRVENLELAEPEPQNERVRIMKEETAEILREALFGVLDENGTGASARPKTVSAAGKTSTAETGIVNEGEKVLNRWFCGFFPYDSPKYAVAVLSDDSSDVCGTVFADLADEITALKKD